MRQPRSPAWGRLGPARLAGDGGRSGNASSTVAIRCRRDNAGESLPSALLWDFSDRPLASRWSRRRPALGVLRPPSLRGHSPSHLLVVALRGALKGKNINFADYYLDEARKVSFMWLFFFLTEKTGGLFFFKEEKNLLAVEYKLALGEGHFNTWAIITSYPSKT